MEEIDYKKLAIEYVTSEVEKILDFEKVTKEKNLLEYGISSIQIMQISSKLRKFGIVVSFANLISKPTLKEWEILIKESKKRTRAHKEVIKNEKKSMDRDVSPFSLTDVQYAYWIGRGEDQSLGGVGCHAYLEFDGINIEPSKLERAWNKLQMYHSMLRAKFLEDGTQIIMNCPYSDHIKVKDFTKKSQHEYEEDLAIIREQLSHRKLNIEEGQVAGITLSLLPKNKTRIHLDVDLLVADVQSISIIIRDLTKLYMGESLCKNNENWSFRDYLLKRAEQNKKDEIKDKEYWQSKINDFPGAPKIPLKMKPELLHCPVFKRRSYFISKEKWEYIKNKAALYHETSAMVLLTVYALILERWSKNQQFLINIPLFNRMEDDDQIQNAVADFTNLLLLDVDGRRNHTFVEMMKNIQNTFINNVEHSNYSGIQVQRDIAKTKCGQRLVAPVVFACNLNTPLESEVSSKVLGNLNYMISQTPQVWLDFQSYTKDQGVLLTWDSVDELFPCGVIDDMFESLTEIMDNLSELEDWNVIFDALPKRQKIKRHEDLKKIVPLPKSTQCLHKGLFESARKYPEKVALIDSISDERLCYRELAYRVRKVATMLKHKGVKAEDVVAVTMPRGINQIISILGILSVGGCYISISIDQPKERREKIYQRIQIPYTLTNVKTNEEIRFPHKTKTILFEESLMIDANIIDPIFPTSNKSAYIIMTSGSTGEPKGVEVSHYSSWNTIKTVNDRYNIGLQDAVLSVSSVDFDLSVYDIFGLLSVGGTVVVISDDTRKDAKHWLNCINKYRITIWNSVPILLDMLITMAEDNLKEKLPLQKVMLSGDWIGLDLPERLKKIVLNAKFIAMGGATEASIWSNAFDVTLPLPDDWKSIPYGKPLKHQIYRVVDNNGRDCPNWVLGELWIGGAGVVKGYKNDDALTKAKFTKINGIPWYKTGDCGKFWNDGTIEFLGRLDNQVKIKGHRIELGEIENALRQYPGIKNTIVDVVEGTKGDKSLVSYVVAEERDAPLLFKEISKNTLQSEKIWNSFYQKNWIDRFNKDKKDIKPEDFLQYSEYANCLSVEFIFNTFRQMGLFKYLGEKNSYIDIVNRFKISSKNTLLIKKWMDILSNVKVLEEINKGEYIYSKTPLKLKKQSCELEKYIQDLTGYIKKLQKYAIPLLKGEVEGVEVFYGEKLGLSPNHLLKLMPGDSYNVNLFIRTLKTVVKNSFTDEPLKILEVGTRDIEVTEEILKALEGYQVEYTYLDQSQFFIENAKKYLNKYPFVEYGIFDPYKDVENQGFKIHSYDCVLAFNSLHRTKNITVALKHITDLLVPSGMFMMSEMTVNSYLKDITAGFLEDGFSHIEDYRKLIGNPMQTADKWDKCLKNTGFVETGVFPIDSVHECGRSVIVGQFKNQVKIFEPKNLKSYLYEKLPEYMIPKMYIHLAEMPITSNGKINRKALSIHPISKISKGDFVNPETETEKWLTKLWNQTLGLEKISIYDNYFELGGDSLIATKLIALIRKQFKIDIFIGTIFERPNIHDLGLVIDDIRDKNNIIHCNNKVPNIIPDKENQFSPFPLTEVQYAYWIGRSGLYELGNVATHCYFELDSENLNIERLSKAWNRLIKYHSMMRAIVLKDGTQKILKEVPKYEIKVTNFNDISEAEVKNYLKEIRNKMSHQVLATDIWPLFDVRASCYGENKVRLHISFDNLIFDGWSMFHILSQWTKLYRDNNVKLPPFEFSFRDYVLGLQKIKETNLYKSDRKYWLDRLESLSPAPELPLAKDPKSISQQKFHRRMYKLKQKEWDNLKNRAKNLGITPSVLLITAYAEVLRMWSRNTDFTINLTQFNRVPMHNDVDKIVGDFTTLTLLEVRQKECKSFLKRAQKVQKQLVLDLEHPYYSGVEVERELVKKTGARNTSIMPIVFTSALGVDQWNEGEWVGKLAYNISQTPQVWLDHQVVEQDGKLCLFWDSMDELFYPGMLDEMFDAYCKLLESLAVNKNLFKRESFSLVNVPICKKRVDANNTKTLVSNKTLDGLFLDAVKVYGDNVAIISNGYSLTYRKLAKYSSLLAKKLKENGVRPKDVVAIFMEKGWEQIVAAYAALFVGATYLPLDPKNPKERLCKIIEDGNVDVILTQSHIHEKVEWLNHKKCFDVDKIQMNNDFEIISHTINTPESLAYIIYTSGSTGMPKGVMIEHKGAVNTILDINKRYSINSKDKILALSNLNFDLSVYDIFGVLAVGGTIVIHKEKKLKDPADWVQIINKEKITLWNTVPAFMQMLIQSIEKRQINIKKSLRLVLLSGDWIPKDLPKKIKMHFSDVKVIGLGGATEASIWSNAFEIEGEIPEKWRSIPYGKPLANQKYYILNKFMLECPNWVPGMLYIAGDGLARGYYNDLDKTNEKFVYHPQTGERLYCTGDMGCYWSDGNIEFLGRKGDAQVKLNGYRVELGEIENAIKKYKNVKDVVVVNEKQGSKFLLIAIVVLDKKSDIKYFEEDLILYLKNIIPEYMIPKIFIPLDNMPLSSNGKIDRKKLKALARETINNRKKKQLGMAPQTDVQNEIWNIWKKILKYDNPGIDDNFFEFGGNSFQAIQLINDLVEKYGDSISIEMLFDNSTIRTLANAIEKNIRQNEGDI